MSANYFQLSLDLDKWTGNVNPRYGENKTLKEIWDDAGKPYIYTPYGINYLLDQLQEKSYFRGSPNVQALRVNSFTRDNGIKTVGDLLGKVRNADTPPLIDYIYENIHLWLELSSGTKTIFGGTILKELWNTPATYNTHGVPKLIRTFQNNGSSQILGCQQVRDLDTVSFTSSSGITNMNKFHHKLRQCGTAG